MKDILGKITKKGKSFILAYDQGLEHGPVDFTDENVNPEDVINLANSLKVTGLAVQKGIAEKYHKQIKVPLIIKLNGKTNLVRGEALSLQLCSVAEAIKLKAAAVGYTIYLGSEHEEQMFQEFSKIEEEAHAKGLAVILWAYPRGRAIENRSSDELMAYATRTALELGADMVKINYNNSPSSLKWAVKAAGKVKVVVAGGPKIADSEALNRTNEIMSSGAAGIAVGRNIWQSKKPMEIGKKLRKIVLD